MNNIEITETAGDYRSGYVENNFFGKHLGKVKIHFIEKNYQKNNRLSLVVSPGLWEPAERALPLFDGIDSHSVSLSYRGRGRSDTPLSGYDLNHHVSDFKTVVDALEIKTFIICAFSRGVGYACGYVQKYPERVKGMILVDHPPIHVKPSPGYAAYWKNLVYLGKPITEYMRAEALDRLEREANEAIFWDSLSSFNFPVLLLRGTSKKSKIPSDLMEEDMIKYRKYLKDYTEINFDYSGHMIVDEELGKYRAVVNDFIEKLSGEPFI